MTVDYQIQPLAPTLPRDADRFCPECGQTLDLRGTSGKRQATGWAWWPGLMVVLGVYLAVAFGIEAWSTQRFAAAREEDLRQVAPRCVSNAGISPACVDAAAKQGLDPLSARLARAVDAAGQARRDFAVAAAGLLAAVARLGATAAPRLQPRGGQRPAAWGQPLRLALRVAALGATALTPGVQLLLTASGALAVARLLAGTPLSWDLVAGSIHRTIELVVAVAQNA